jgi:hypothetical protein
MGGAENEDQDGRRLVKIRKTGELGRRSEGRPRQKGKHKTLCQEGDERGHLKECKMREKGEENKSVCRVRKV